ncbi:MAG: BrxA family protein [Candidatus Rokuibacteriota bacterium]
MRQPRQLSKPTISTFSVTKGGRIADTYACFAQWDLSATLDENLARFQRENPILASTGAWLKEMRRIFRVRFGDIERHVPLIRLAQARMPEEQWSPILLWHLCFRELLLSDFLETWLYPHKQEGLLRVRAEDVREYLQTLKPRGLVHAAWTETTISRMASGLPSFAADFGLLQGKAVKEIAPLHLPDEALLYVLHALGEEMASGERILSDIRWRRFLLSREELEPELLRLHQHRRLRCEVAGSLVVLELPYQTVGEYVDHLVR